MNHILIMNYIRKLSKDDVIRFIRNQNLSITNDEIDIIYNYIKSRSREFLLGNHQGILKELQSKLSQNTYSKILEYYEMYKDKL